MTGGDLLLEKVERVEVYLPGVAIGGDEIPLPVHPAVRHDRRAFQVVVAQEPHPS
jgi:hypothetical protein